MNPFPANSGASIPIGGGDTIPSAAEAQYALSGAQQGSGPTVWFRGLTNTNQAIVNLAQGPGSTWDPNQNGVGTDKQFNGGIKNGNILYYFAGINTPQGLVDVDANYVQGINTPGAGLPPGWYMYRPPGAGAAVGGELPLGQALGTQASDASDFAWALQQCQSGQWASYISTKLSGGHLWPFNDPYSAIAAGGTTGSPSTLTQVAPGAVTPAATPSSSQYLIYALIAAGLAFAYYEL